MTKKINNINIQGRIYPEIVKGVMDDACKRKQTPTFRLAEIAAKAVGLPMPQRKNARQRKEDIYAIEVEKVPKKKQKQLKRTDQIRESEQSQ